MSINVTCDYEGHCLLPHVVFMMSHMQAPSSGRRLSTASSITQGFSRSRWITSFENLFARRLMAKVRTGLRILQDTALGSPPQYLGLANKRNLFFMEARVHSGSFCLLSAPRKQRSACLFPCKNAVSTWGCSRSRLGKTRLHPQSQEANISVSPHCCRLLNSHPLNSSTREQSADINVRVTF